MEQTVFHRLYVEGQSVWLNAILGEMINSRTLQKLISLGLRGINSNLPILDTELSSGKNYNTQLAEFCKSYKTPFEIYDALVINNVQIAADMFYPVYEITKGLDGYVSLDINPKFVHISQAIVQEGIRLFEKIRRPNVMFKIIATDEGLKAMEELLAYGINVHMTYIFSPEQYHKTAQAYIRGSKRFLEKGALGQTIGSVASIFPRQIDATVNKLLNNTEFKKDNQTEGISISELKRKVGISTCAVIYRSFLDYFSSEEFMEIKSKGVHIQRISWNLTNIDNTISTDTNYINEFIAQNTISTISTEMFKAFLENDEINIALTSDVTDAQNIIDNLKNFGISIDENYNNLLNESIGITNSAFDSILQTLESKKQTI